MKHPLAAVAALALAAAAAAPINAETTDAHQSRSASVIIVWRIGAPHSSDPGVQSVEAGLVAQGLIAPQLATLSRRPGAKATFALDPGFVAALERAAQGNSVLASLAAGTLGADDARTTQLLDLLSSDVVPAPDFAASPVGKRFASDATAARLALAGDQAAHFSRQDDVDFAASAVALALASGADPAARAWLRKTSLSQRDLLTLAGALARASRAMLDGLTLAAARGSVELAAIPAYEPIMPLVINAAGRERRVPFTVNLDAGRDVGYAVDAGLRAAQKLSPTQGPAGVFAPAGAYDDETATVLQTHGAAYGIFSERVVKANAGSSSQAVSDVHAAAFRPYLLETSKTDKLPILFCSDQTSLALEAQPPGVPAAASAATLRGAVAAAAAASPQGSSAVVVVCLDGMGGIARRPDRAAVLDALATMLGGNTSMRASTPKEFLREHPPTSETYGYAPGSDAGGFDLWMGSANQMSLWSALSDARTAAGGDAALQNQDVRELLLRAESGAWYLSVATPQPRALADRSLARFRSLIADIYRAAGKPVPADIAPVKLDTVAPVGIEAQ